MRRSNPRHAGTRTLRRAVGTSVRPVRFRDGGSGISGISTTRGKPATRVHGRLRAFSNRESRFQLRDTGEHSHAPPPRSRETMGIGLRARVSMYSDHRSDEPFERDYHAVVLSRTFKVIRETVLARWRWEGDWPATPPAGTLRTNWNLSRGDFSRYLRIYALTCLYIWNISIRILCKSISCCS